MAPADADADAALFLVDDGEDAPRDPPTPARGERARGGGDDEGTAPRHERGGAAAGYAQRLVAETRKQLAGEEEGEEEGEGAAQKQPQEQANNAAEPQDGEAQPPPEEEESEEKEETAEDYLRQVDTISAAYGPPEWASLERGTWYGAIGPSHGGIDPKDGSAERRRRRALEARRWRHIQQNLAPLGNPILACEPDPDRARLDAARAVHAKGHLSRMARMSFGGRMQAEEDLVASMAIRARTRDLSHIDAMQLAKSTCVAAPLGTLGQYRTVPCILIDGAHCGACGKLMEEDERADLLLWCHIEARKVASKGPFVIVYFHSDADLSAIPDIKFFRLLHACVGRDVRKNLAAFYVVHPNRHWVIWQAMLRVLCAEVYSKVRHLDSLAALFAVFPELKEEDMAEHVLHCDAQRLAAKMG